MEVDVLTEIEIARPRAEVAAFVCDPDNATSWYRNIKRVEWVTAKPLRMEPDSPSLRSSLGARSPTPTRSGR